MQDLNFLSGLRKVGCVEYALNSLFQYLLIRVHFPPLPSAFPSAQSGPRLRGIESELVPSERLRAGECRTRRENEISGVWQRRGARAPAAVCHRDRRPAQRRRLVRVQPG